jgi:hypothetical protein
MIVLSRASPSPCKRNAPAIEEKPLVIGEKMKTRKLWIQIAVVLLLVASVASADDAPMQPYTSTDGRFSILFPGAPSPSSQSISLKNGGKVMLYQLDAEADGGNTSYTVMYNDYTPDVITGPPQDLLKRTRDGAVAGKTLLTDTEIELGGVPGRAYTATDADGWQYDVHEFLAGTRFYQLIITTAKGHTAIQRDAFMDSFKIL